jgi:DNA-binding response OmpR family regulator
VVLVDDHEAVRFALAEFCRQQGANVVVGDDGVDGPGCSQKSQSGYCSLRYPSAETGCLRTLRRIADRGRITAAGFAARLDKPFCPDELLETIKAIL